MLEKLDYKYHIKFFTNIVFNAAVLCTTSVLWFLSLPQMKEESKNIQKKLKALSHSEMQNVGSSAYVDGLAVNTTAEVICNSQHINKTHIITSFTIKHDKF